MTLRLVALLLAEVTLRLTPAAGLAPVHLRTTVTWAIHDAQAVCVVVSGPEYRSSCQPLDDDRIHQMVREWVLRTPGRYAVQAVLVRADGSTQTAAPRSLLVQ